MLTVIIGLTGALIFGAADFLGGLASKLISSIRVTALAAAVGLVVLLLALPLIGGAWSPEAVLYGGLSGIAGAGAIVLLYACLAIGPMSILSPLTAVVSAIVPMTAGLLRGETLQPVGYLALGLALVAVVLVGFVPEKNAVRPSVKALAMATGSGTLIGAFMILIDMTPDDSGLVPLVVNRGVNAAIMFTAIGVIALLAGARRRSGSALGAQGAQGAQPAQPAQGAQPVRPAGGWLPGLRLVIFCGILDAVANTLMLLGLRLGELTVMSVLTAMYSAGTILLAAIVLQERLAKLQVVGLVLALASSAMLALS